VAESSDLRLTLIEYGRGGCKLSLHALGKQVRDPKGKGESDFKVMGRKGSGKQEGKLDKMCRRWAVEMKH
jgi:hypothetical protein